MSIDTTRIPATLLEVTIAALKRLFGALPPDLLNDVVGASHMVSLSRGETLYTQGEAGGSMHILLTGKLEVIVTGADATRRSVAMVHSGDCVGEMALLTGAPRAAELRAARDCLLAEVPGNAFETVMRQHPQALADISRMIIKRLTSTDAGRGEQYSARSVVIFPGGDGSECRMLAPRIARELLHHGSTLHLTAADMRQLVPSGDRVARNEFLEQASHRYRFLILEADPADEDWTRTTIGFADRIFVAAPASGEARPRAFEARLLGAQAAPEAARTELVLLYQPGESPNGTRKWLDSRKVARHHHIPVHGESGIQRLARDIAGESIGVVFAGGGARGFAHLGVIRALIESGVAIDAVGGTSFGAIAATGPARGFDIERMIDELRHVFTQERPLDDITLPMVSLVHGERLDELLRRYLDFDIEDLWLPYFAVSSNLTRNRIEVHDRGSLWRAVRASVSLPAILPPVIRDGELLIDGGVLNNLPVDVMSERIKGRIIAVDLSAQQETQYSFATMPTGMEYLKSRLLPWKKPIEVPTLAKVMMKTTTLASRREVEFARRMAHLYLSVPMSDFDLLDWNEFHDIVETGYRYASGAVGDYVTRNPRVVRRPPISELVAARGR